MNREEIIKLAREAGLGTSLCHNSVEGDRVWIEGADWHDELERFAALVAAKEREACAQVCVDAIASIRGFGTEDAKQTGINVCNNLAAAIRARGEK